MISETLRAIQLGHSLSESDMVSCMSQIMEGQWDDPQISAFVMDCPYAEKQ